MSSAVDAMSTALDLPGVDIPEFPQGRSPAPAMRGPSLPGREHVVSSLPFANPGDPVHPVDHLLRTLTEPPVMTVTSGAWSLLYSPLPGVSQLYNMDTGTNQVDNSTGTHTDATFGLHQRLVRFMRETGAPERLPAPRMELRI